MTYFPRTAPYQKKYLSDKDREAIWGFDYALEDIESFLNNQIEESGSETLDKIRKEFLNSLLEDYKQWHDGTRQQLIVSFVDNYSEEEFKKLKERAENSDESE